MSYDENCVFLSKEKHSWLEHGSFLRCGGDLVQPFSAGILMESLEKQEHPERQGILGEHR
ncbi:MAG: hypothetical protein ISN28_14030 [Ectothiorhodospiraceae bacterium AqS1]|nr:hypothetical protein [Ectothiorhodospiraceae bacterium AqS1]